MKSPHRVCPWRVITAGCLAWTVCGFAPAAASADVWTTIVRRTAKVADDVPVRQADDLIDSMRQSRGLQETMNARFPRAARAGDEAELAAKQAARRASVRTALNAATEGVDPAVLRSLDELDDVARETALMLAEGGRHASNVVPDIATRAALLRRGGMETLAGVGMYGEDAARAALRLDTAVQAGRLSSGGAVRAATVADFGRLLNRYGDAGWSFWSRYVTPHWGKWLAGGALTAYLLAPEEFMNTTGELTEQGAKRLTELVGSTTAAIIRGAGGGAGRASEEIGKAFRDTYLSGWQGVLALLGTAVLLSVVLPGPRRLAWSGVRKLAMGRSASQPAAKSAGVEDAAQQPETR